MDGSRYPYPLYLGNWIIYIRFVHKMWNGEKEKALTHFSNALKLYKDLGDEENLKTVQENIDFINQN
jgi:hypothetical protein